LNVCTLLDKEIEICAEIWNQCHGKQEIQRMKNGHIERFLESKADDPTIQKCQTVKIFRESNTRDLDAVDESGCTDTENTAAMDKFATCNHNILTKVYDETQGLTSPDKIIFLYCKALEDLSHVCVHHWEPCFAPGDQHQMLLAEMKQKKTYLIQLANGQIPEDSLNQCEQKMKDKSFVSPAVRDVSPTEPPRSSEQPSYDPDYDYDEQDDYADDNGDNQGMLNQVETRYEEVYDKIEEILGTEANIIADEDETIALPKTDDRRRPAGIQPSAAVTSIEDSSAAGSYGNSSSAVSSTSIVLFLSFCLLSILL